jgi:collagen triple helix repeat protein
MMNVEALAGSVVEAIREFVERRFTPILERIAAVERFISGIPSKEALRGEKGDKGDPGEPGQSIKGEPGEKGLSGEDGRDGRDGPPGMNGRDAIRLDPLPSIEVEQSYPRDTYAHHRGGIIRSLRVTDPIVNDDIARAGWVVAMDGTAGITQKHVDFGRFIEQTVELTSGRKFMQRWQTREVVYRGFWQEGKEYQPGDTVVVDGSLWICDQPNTKQPGKGEAATEWRLCARKGRDAR